MSDRHTLATMEKLDLGHGKGSLGDHVAVCACGWRSDPEPDKQAALDRLTEHAEAND
ncbi:hypothetical protein GCM10027261_09150 [Geodermatophilus arenarius]|uniref:Uncharacterized protein n=1 Tax=Geodermatophilus arenarius TaxID=1137990 RepID=A0ABV9LR12_9ACTN